MVLDDWMTWRVAPLYVLMQDLKGSTRLQASFTSEKSSLFFRSPPNKLGSSLILIGLSIHHPAIGRPVGNHHFSTKTWRSKRLRHLLPVRHMFGGSLSLLGWVPQCGVLQPDEFVAGASGGSLWHQRGSHAVDLRSSSSGMGTVSKDMQRC